MIDLKILVSAVARASLNIERGFSFAMDYLLAGRIADDWHDRRVHPETKQTLIVGDTEFVVIESDVLHPIEIGAQCVLVILGNVFSTIKAGPLCEVVVAGTLSLSGTVAGESLQLFVGGNSDGQICLRGRNFVWIEKSLRGDIEFGPLYLALYVRADCTGRLLPSGQPMLDLNVTEYLPFDTLTRLSSANIRSLRAAIGMSDHDAGVFPDRQEYQRISSERRTTYWVINSNREHGSMN